VCSAGTSSGGGCCDCGDTEAWKSEPFCDIHLTGSETRPDSAGHSLPGDLAERARATFTAVLKYAFQLLTLEHSPGLPSDLRMREADDDPLGFLDTADTYCTVLFNDETHTFDQVRKQTNLMFMVPYILVMYLVLIGLYNNQCQILL
jgi:E3 ubiquitin-protein ligase UBR2